MKCGEFDKRNLDYQKVFDAKKYFENLLLLQSDYSSKDLCIFDVGAHKGESAILFSSLFPHAAIHSFEPNPVAVKQIQLLSIPNLHINATALSDQAGNATFYVQDISHLSSLSGVNQSSKASLGYAQREKHEEITVPMQTGDEYCRLNGIQRIDLLKIDVQANEVKTLRGFSAMMPKIRAVFVEVSFYDFYTQKSNIRDVEQLLPGFELFDIYEVSKNPKTLGTDWATLAYRNLLLPG